MMFLPYIICTNDVEYGGVNYEGRRQQGVDEKVLKHIANAYRLVFHGKTSVFDAVNQIKDQVPDGPEIHNHIIEFLQVLNEIGIITKDPVKMGDSLITGGAGYPCCYYTVANGIQLFATCFLQTLCGRLAVDGVDHHLLRTDAFQGVQPGAYKRFAGIVDRHAVAFAAHEHGLYDDVAVEGFHAFDDGVDVVSAVGTVYLIYIVGVYGVQFQDVVVDPHQCVVHLLPVDEGGVRQDTDLGFRTIQVAQADGVVDDFGKMRMARGLAIAGKGQHVGQLPTGLHLLKLCLQFACHFLA